MTVFLLQDIKKGFRRLRHQFHAKVTCKMQPASNQAARHAVPYNTAKDHMGKTRVGKGWLNGPRNGGITQWVESIHDALRYRLGDIWDTFDLEQKKVEPGRKTTSRSFRGFPSHVALNSRQERGHFDRG